MSNRHSADRAEGARPKNARLTHRIDAYDVEEFLAELRRWDPSRFGYVVTPNADHFIRLHEDAHFRRYYEDAAYVLLDSRFVALIARLTRGVHLKVCTGADLTEAVFFQLARPRDGIVVIGGTREQAHALAARYGLRRLAHHNPPMGFIHDPAALEACCRFIEEHSPFRFCILGVGSPQQERLAYVLSRRNQAQGFVLCVGAAINFLTDTERRAPRWMQEWALEWLFRLVQNPRRLAHRYLIRGPRVFAYLYRSTLEVRQAQPGREVPRRVSRNWPSGLSPEETWP